MKLWKRRDEPEVGGGTASNKVSGSESVGAAAVRESQRKDDFFSDFLVCDILNSTKFAIFFNAVNIDLSRGSY